MLAQQTLLSWLGTYLGRTAEGKLYARIPTTVPRKDFALRNSYGYLCIRSTTTTQTVHLQVQHSRKRFQSATFVFEASSNVGVARAVQRRLRLSQRLTRSQRNDLPLLLDDVNELHCIKPRAATETSKYQSSDNSHAWQH